MTKLNANTVLTDPGTLVPVPLAAGEEVPVWAAGLVGEHLLVAEPARKPAAK